LDEFDALPNRKKFTLATGIQVHFWGLKSPWQQESSKDGNRHLRHYFPNGTDVSIHLQIELNAVDHRLSQQARKTSDYETLFE
jgi:IS30 family transposase